MTKFISTHINSILWSVIILILCGAPSSGFPSIRIINIPHLDKVVHLGLYFVFTILLISENNALRSKGGVTKRAIYFAFALSIPYGVLIELLQLLLFTSRSADFIDILANTSGAILATLVYQLLNKSTKGLI